MEMFYDITEKLTEELFEGDICVGSLRMLITRKKPFQKIVAAIKDSRSDQIFMVLNGRNKELHAFENVFQDIQEFTQFCHKCKADTETLKHHCETIIRTGLDTVSLDTLVDTSIFVVPIDLQSYQPSVIAFEHISPRILSSLPDIVKSCKIPCFLKFGEGREKKFSNN
ncbi:unnamed protein product [Mytilus edulis]|uniref:Uncharacterized protein n=1 Tax=Mytilus edulis TaxID=6550 RepID=A0A8S3S2K2_MYTED|nr:unnamed protein product [Mytilus edulis]